MTIDHVERFVMQRGTSLALSATRPLEVAAVTGALWLTQDNDLRDLVLNHGERMLLRVPRRVLAYALEDALMEVRKMTSDRACK